MWEVRREAEKKTKRGAQEGMRGREVSERAVKKRGQE